MKKFVFSAVAAFCMLSASAQNQLYSQPVKAEKGTTVNIPIILHNDYLCVQVQYDVYLPAGFSYVKSGRGGFDKNTSMIIPKNDESTDRSYYAFTTWNGQFNKTSGGVEFLRFIGTGAEQDYIEEGEGEIMKLPVKVGDVADGVYPILIKGVKTLSYDNTQGENGVAYVSYIVVGNPTNASLEFGAGAIPTGVNEKLAEETGISNLNLSAVTGVKGAFTYVDGREVVAPTTPIEADLKYAGTKSGYYSINLPFDGTSVTGDVYTIDEYAIDYWLFVDADGVTKGNTVLAKGDVTVTGHGNIEGVQTKTNQAGTYVYEDKIWSGENLTVKPMRGLFIDDNASNVRRIVINGQTTGITNAQIDGEAVNTFDLQGRQTVNAKNGVFVVNGKKQIVK